MGSNIKSRRIARRLYRRCLADGVLDEDRARRVVQGVVAAPSRSRLTILSHFRRLVMLDRAQHSAAVETAKPLPTELRKDLEEQLTRLYGPGLTTSFVESPALIGGMRIKVGSDVYDGSIRSRLDALEARF
jgi:F-type H+-transporting ATPase subunit delta